MANGTAIHGFELDDLHSGSGLHPGAVVVPAVIAVAESRGATGAAALASIVAGYEIAARLGIAGGVTPSQRGFHTTGIVGSVASAAAVANLLALDVDATSDALAIGAAQSSGLACARRGAMTKRFHAGHAAQAGVIAGLLAERGFSGSNDVVEAPFGGYLSTFSEGMELAALTDGLGTRWETGAVGFKLYAACANAHTMIDGLDKLMRDGLRAETLVHLRVGMTQLSFKDVAWPYKPSNVAAAQMNGFYAAAVKLLDGDAFIDQYREERIADPRILEIIARISIVHDAELDAGGIGKRHASWIAASLSDGRVLNTYTEQRRGSRQHPLTREEITIKFRKIVATGRNKSAVPELEHLVLGLDRLPTLETLTYLLLGD
jgi:2-methylcitrate dehydratase PrpD